MVIERTEDEVIIRLPAYVNTDELQQLINLLSYKEATAKSEATQEEVDELAKEVKKGWWVKNYTMVLKTRDLKKVLIHRI